MAHDSTLHTLDPPQGTAAAGKATPPPWRRTRKLCGLAVAAVGGLALLGWLLWVGFGRPEAQSLTTLGFESIPLAPNTAVAFLLLGGGLWLLARPAVPGRTLWLVRCAGLLVASLVLLRLLEIESGADLWLHRWFLALPGETYHEAPTGRMALSTAVTLLAASAALLLFTFPTPLKGVATGAEFLAVVVAALGLIFFLGYLYGGPFISGDPALIPMALNTALGAILLGVGLVAAAGPDSILLSNLAGPSIQARLLRAFLPLTALTVCVVAWLMHAVSRQGPSSAALLSAVLAVAAIFLVSFVCLHIARVVGGQLERAGQELRQAERQSRSYAAELERLNTSLEQRVTERTAALQESRDHLEQFFTLSTALQDPDNLEKAFDLVLRFCQRLGYDRAMVSLVDRPAGVIRAVKAAGTLTEIVRATVRRLDGNDILAIVAREGQTVVIPDCPQDQRCDQAAIAAAGIRGQIVIPLISGTEVLGTLQVASRAPLAPTGQEVRTLETLAGQTARALAGLLHLKEIQRLNRELAERNRQLQELADDLAATAHAERQARDALRETERRTRLIVDTAHDAFVAMDSNGAIRDWNRQAEVTFGWPRQEALGRPLDETLIPPLYRREHRDGLARFLATGAGPLLNRRIETTALHRDGHEFPVELTIVPTPWEGSYVFNAFLHDISDRKRAEEALKRSAAELTRSNEQLQQLADDLRQTVESERRAHEALKQTQTQLVQAEKLAALGQLVAGVAHEINNPLSYVSNNVAVLQRDVRALRDLLGLYREGQDLLRQERPELEARIRALAEGIDLEYTLANLEGLMARSRDGLKRIQQIVKDLRDFARLDESDLHEVDLNAGIESTINIIQGQAKKRQVALTTDLAPLPGVTCYPAKINQVVLNLVANAIDACSPGGKVTVCTRAEGDAVAIAVADNGSGIDPAIGAKIFDPFFTTKPQGKGTGLGLSISYGIVQAHGGTITFESTPGRGTRFSVRLPRRPPAGAGKGSPE